MGAPFDRDSISSTKFVIPANAGTQGLASNIRNPARKTLGSRVRGNDGWRFAGRVAAPRTRIAFIEAHC
jgi:hypothetical protein